MKTKKMMDGIETVFDTSLEFLNKHRTGDADHEDSKGVARQGHLLNRSVGTAIKLKSSEPRA